MNKPLAVIGLVLGSCAFGRCDLLLNAGDVFTYPFQTIPLEGTVLPPRVMVVNAHFGYGLDPATFDPNLDVVRIEAFETSTNEPPFFSQTAPYAGSGWIDQAGHWLDVQGVLRITVVAGSVVLRAIQVGAVTPRSSGGYYVYNTPTLPVPLPALEIQHTLAGAVVAWPADFTTWTLEGTDALGPTNQWTTITNAPILVGSKLTITDTAPAQSRYYRLRRP